MPQPTVGDLRVCEIQSLQVRQPFQVDQTCVGNLCSAEVEPFQIRQQFQVSQVGICEKCGCEFESLQVWQRVQLDETRLHAPEIQSEQSEFRHSLQVIQPATDDQSVCPKMLDICQSSQIR